MRGGLGDYTRELARALAQNGVEVHVLTHVRGRGAASGPLDLSGVHVHPVVPAWTWRGLATVVAHLRALQPDIVHLQYQTAAYGLHPAINTLFLWLRGRPHVRRAITYHDLRDPYLFPKAGPLRRWVTLLPARHADLVVATNPEDEATLRAAGVRPVRIPIGPNVHPVPVSAAAVRAFREAYGIPPTARVVGYFGFLNRTKGVTDLVDALAHLVARGWDVHLLMLGEPVGASDPTNQAYREEVLAHIARRGFTARVHWTGFLADEDLSCGFAACDVVVLPYRDGASLRRGTLQAALAFGAAIVTTTPRVPTPELTDAGALVLVPPAAPDALAAAVERLLTNPAERSRRQEAARRLAGRFTWEAIAAQHLQAYSAWA